MYGQTKTERRRTLVDLPIRSEAERTRPLPPAVARLIELPSGSQVGPGAQLRRNDCGPACVRMALDFLGLAPGVTIDALAAQADPSDDGTTAEDLVALAAAHGATATPLYLPPGALPDAPAILLVRYCGFRRDIVEDKNYWDASAADATFRHWLWWLGNDVIDGQLMTVWNDPLYSAGSGKNVLHTPDEFNSAFVPYGSVRIALTFDGITNPPAPDGEPLVVFAFDSDGINLRSEPSTQDPNTILASLPQGQRFTVLEGAANARIKLSGGQYWLRVRTNIGGVDRDGYVAAWLVRAVEGGSAPEPTPGAPYTWQDVINATAIVGTQAQADWNVWLGDAGFWALFANGLRPQPYTGPAIDGWPIALALRQQITELLKLSSDQLVQKVTEALQAAEQSKPQPNTATRAPGAIVGIHGPPGVGCPPPSDQAVWIGKMRDMGVKWFKQCDDGDPNQRQILAWATRLKQAGIEPIIRYFAARQFPNPLPDPYFDKMRQYADAGITWAEIGNEPNLDYEWQEGFNGRVDYHDPEVIRLLADGWVKDAQRAIAAGVRPAFYAFGPTDWRGGVHPKLSSVNFTSRIASYLAEQHRDEAIGIFRQGGWFAVHCATYEQPDDFDPFRSDNTIWDMTLRGYEVVRKCFRDAFGAALDVDKIPIMSTEGGVFTPDSTSMAGHTRLNTEEEHTQRVVNMFRWLEGHSPLQAMCPWCLSAEGFGGPFDARYQNDGWFRTVAGALQPRPVIDALRQLRASTQPAVIKSPAAPIELSASVRRALLDIGIVPPASTVPAQKQSRSRKAATKAAKAKAKAKPKPKPKPTKAKRPPARSGKTAAKQKTRAKRR